MITLNFKKGCIYKRTHNDGVVIFKFIRRKNNKSFIEGEILYSSISYLHVGEIIQLIYYGTFREISNDEWMAIAL